MLYFGINIFVSLFSWLHGLSPKLREHRVFYTLIGAFFILLIGLRGNEDEYTRLFVKVPELSSFFSDTTIAFETGFGFAFICSFLKTLGFGSQALLFLFAFAAIAINLYYFNKYTKYFFLALLIYLSHEVIHHEWIQIRAGLVSALILPQIYLLGKKKYKSYFLVFLFSFSIHYISILSILILFLNHNYKTIYLVIIFSMGLIFNSIGGLTFFLDHLGQASLLPSRIELYLSWDKYSYQVSFFHPKVLQQIVTSIFIIYLYNRFPDFRSNYLIINAYILSTVLMVSFLDFAILSFRSSTHFVCVEPIMLTLLIKYFKYPQLMQTMIIIVFLLISYINYIHNGVISEYVLFVRQ
jgi:hypothetical protein